MLSNIEVRAVRSDDHTRKVACPQCRARLFDLNTDNWDYKAIILRMGDKTSIDIAQKCPKCKALVGISLERIKAPIMFRTVTGTSPTIFTLPTPYRVIILEEGTGA